MTSEKLKAWMQAGRAPFFVATLIPLSLGAAVAKTSGHWDTGRWALVLIASFLVHLSTNLANDYFEYNSGADEGDSIGGSRVLQEGKISLLEIRNAIIICYATAFVCGVWIVLISGVQWLAPIMLFSFLSSVFYTAPPIRYGYYGLGELFVSINMGPIMVAGTTAAIVGQFDLRALWLSIPIGIMVALILFYQSLSDIEVDRSVGKFTLAVHLGREYSLWAYRVFIVAAYCSIVLLVLNGIVGRLALVSFVTLPAAVGVDRMISSSIDWRELHDKGSRVRVFYLVNGLILIAAVLIG